MAARIASKSATAGSSRTSSPPADCVRCGSKTERSFSLAHHREGTTHQITIGASRLDVEIVDPLALRRKRGDDHLGDSGIIKALMPGRIARVLVEKGAEVRRGTGLLVLEAMKMENEIPAPADGVVDEIFVKAGDTVEGGADLLHLRAL